MKYLAFDKRALALMRICIALVIIIDLSIRITDLEAFYSNTGVAPLAMIFERVWNEYFISLHTISGLWHVQLFLFLVAYLFAFMLLIGYRTPLATFLSWLMLLSIHNRNGLILQGGDDLLRMVLFWGIFIPWGKRYSYDRIFSNLKDNNNILYSVAVFAYLLQICYLYTGSALLKGVEWDTHYTALYYVYSLDQIAYPITRYFYYYPELLKKLTFISYYFELLIPLLFFIPIKHSWFRLIGVLGVILFHLINSLTLLVGLFPLIGIATVVGILPSFAMDKLEQLTYRIKGKIENLFIGLGSLIRSLISWRPSNYVLPPTLEKVKMAVLVFLTVFVFDWNFSNLTFINSKLSPHLRPIGYGLRLDQNWGMFAPGVFKDDGWYVLEGTTEKGDKFNLLAPNDSLTYNKPRSVVAMFKNDRWRKYSENLILTYNDFTRGYFCNYSRRIWNETHPERTIKSLRIIYVGEFSLPDYQYAKPEINILFECGP